MTEIRQRIIHTNVSSRQIPELLQLTFAAEFIAPSELIWIVSPWISDIPIIDNSTNSFLYLESSWSRGPVRFSKVLCALAELGTKVHIATRPDAHNNNFLAQLNNGKDHENVCIHKEQNLHEKGIVGDGFYIGGSMNFTFNGITINEEAVIYDTNPQIVAEKRITFADRWGR